MGQSPTKAMWDKFMSEALDETRKLSKDILNKKWNGLVETEDDINQIVIKSQAIFAQKHAYVLRQIHMLYDESKDGTLEPDELEVITRDSLKALREWMPKMFEAIMESSLSYMVGRFSLEQVRQLRLMYAEKMPMMKREIKRWVDQQLIDVKELSQQMFDVMDDDKSGRITTKEFLASYSGASIEVLDPQTFMLEMEARIYNMDKKTYKKWADEQDKLDRKKRKDKQAEEKKQKKELQAAQKAKDERRKARQQGIDKRRLKSKRALRSKSMGGAGAGAGAEAGAEAAAAEGPASGGQEEKKKEDGEDAEEKSEKSKASAGNDDDEDAEKKSKKKGGSWLGGLLKKPKKKKADDDDDATSQVSQSQSQK